MNRYSYEWSGDPLGTGHWRLRDKHDNAIGFCYSEHNAITITDALNAKPSGVAAICELDGCCMLRDKPLPQRELK